MPLGLSVFQISIIILDRLYISLFFISATNPCPTYLLIQLKMVSLFPPAASSSIPLPNGLLAPPTMPSLGDYFPCGSVNLGKYVLCSSALSQRVCWRTSLAMSLCGQGKSPFLMDDNAGNAATLRIPKTCMQRFIYARRDTADGPLEIIPPEESMWYKFYVRNFLYQ